MVGKIIKELVKDFLKESDINLCDWDLIDVEDAGSMCEVCDFGHPIRYVYHLHAKRSGKTLALGCVCAEKMLNATSSLSGRLIKELDHFLRTYGSLEPRDNYFWKISDDLFDFLISKKVFSAYELQFLQALKYRTAHRTPKQKRFMYECLKKFVVWLKSHNQARPPTYQFPTNCYH